MLLMCSPRLDAMAARQTAAPTATTTQINLFSKAITERLSEGRNGTQQRSRSGASRQADGIENIVLRVERTDVAGVPENERDVPRGIEERLQFADGSFGRRAAEFVDD